MPKSKIIIRFSAFLFLITLSSSFGEVGEPCAKVAGLVGTANYNEGYSIDNGQKLNQGSQIQTGLNSRLRLILRDESIIEIGDNTQLILSGCDSTQNIDKINLEIEFGILRARVSKDFKNQKREFNIKTSTSDLAVKGTEFYVIRQQETSGQVAERIAVSEGRVEVKSLFEESNTTLLEKGNEVRFEGKIENSRGKVKVESNGSPQLSSFTSSEQEELEDYFQVDYGTSSETEEESNRELDSKIIDQKDESDESGIDFQHEDAFIDNEDAIKSEHYVRRAILSTIVNTTGKFEFNRVYLNHLMGFSAIYQQKNGPIKFTKYTSGMQGLSVGYVTGKGHAFELGLEASSVSNLFAGYRYIWRPETFSMWPFAGVGIGTEISSLRLSQGPTEAENYGRLGGMKQMGFGTLGVLIPVVEVGIKAEIRANFYGLDRMVLSQGLGLILFL